MSYADYFGGTTKKKKSKRKGIITLNGKMYKLVSKTKKKGVVSFY